MKEIDRTIGEMDEPPAPSPPLSRNRAPPLRRSAETSCMRRRRPVRFRPASSMSRKRRHRPANGSQPYAVRPRKSPVPSQSFGVSSSRSSAPPPPKLSAGVAALRGRSGLYFDGGQPRDAGDDRNMSEGGALIAGADALPAGAQGRLAVKGLGLDVQFTVVEAGPAGLRLFADRRGRPRPNSCGAGGLWSRRRVAAGPSTLRYSR